MPFVLLICNFARRWGVSFTIGIADYNTDYSSSLYVRVLSFAVHRALHYRPINGIATYT